MKIVINSFHHCGMMSSRKYTSVLLFIITLGCLGWSRESPARQNSISGGVSIGPDYDSNVFKSDAIREDEWKSQVAPQLSFSSKGLTDTFSLTYAPQFTYNHRRDDDEMAQTLSFMADKGFSSRWKVTMSGNYSAYDNLYFEPIVGGSTIQNFLRVDPGTQTAIVQLVFPELIPWNSAIDMDKFLQKYITASPAQQAQVDVLLTQGGIGGRQRYWTSAMGVSSAYEFADKSAITLGYRLASLDYKTGLIADHFEQTPSLLVTYQFNPQWRGEVGYELRRTTYDTTEDSTANSPHMQIDFQVSPTNLLFWNYNYQMLTFDGILGDTTDQSSHLGWKHGFDPRTTLTTTIGTSYLGLELGKDEREYSLDLGLSRTFDRGTIAVSGKGLTAMANSAGSWDKSRRSWQLSSNVAYQLIQDLSSTGRLSYGQWDSWVVGLDNSYDRLQIGTGLSYGFKRWFTLSLNYDYNLFDTGSSITLVDYTEHLIALRLSATKELLRW